MAGSRTPAVRRLRQPEVCRHPTADAKESISNGNRLMRYIQHGSILLMAISVLIGIGCNQGVTAPALNFDQQKVKDIRSQIDQFEWE